MSVTEISKPTLDAAALEAEARKEVAEELGKYAKLKIKDSLHAIAKAERVVANLKAEHQVLLRDIGSQ
jgi:hypothetical protein